MLNGRNSGKRKSGRQERNKNERGGRTVVTAAPALFAFMGSASSFGGLSALGFVKTENYIFLGRKELCIFSLDVLAFFEKGIAFPKQNVVY